MKLANLKAHICNTFNQIKQWVSKNISKMSKAGKIAMTVITVLGIIVGLISNLLTIKGTIDKPQDTQPPTPPVESFNVDETAQTSSGEQGDDPINNTVKCELPEMSESGYIEYLNCVIGSEFCIVYCHYNDFNDDGDCEMFALVTPQKEISGVECDYEDGVRYYGDNMTGEIWFVDQDGARKVEETTYCSVSEPFQVGKRKFFRYGQNYTAAGSITFLWGVNKEGKPYQPNISGKGYGLSINSYHEIELTSSSFDTDYDAELGSCVKHTWKPYYFYWDGTNFKEYAGKLIFIDQVYSINGSKELLEQAYSELKNSYNSIREGRQSCVNAKKQHQLTMSFSHINR